MRHAEKRRSCVHSDFAERVAEAALAAYRALPPSAAEERGAQPVVAAFVLEPPDGGELTVVSLGAGTRFSCTGKADEPRDGHAEVVARRGLKRFLGRVLRGDAGVQQWPDLIDGRGEFVGGLHLYVSSCPCGNAVSEPPRYNAAGVRIDAVADANGRDAGQAYAQHAPLSFASVPADVSAAPKFDKIGAPLSCSDKIATWSCVGVQGARLLGPGLLEGPVYLRSVVVGRKFNARRLRRAACCRVRNFETPPFKCHHPAVLGCAARLSEAVVAAPSSLPSKDLGVEIDASCLLWCAGDAAERFEFFAPREANALWRCRAEHRANFPHRDAAYVDAKRKLTSGHAPAKKFRFDRLIFMPDAPPPDPRPRPPRAEQGRRPPTRGSPASSRAGEGGSSAWYSLCGLVCD